VAVLLVVWPPCLWCGRPDCVWLPPPCLRVVSTPPWRAPFSLSALRTYPSIVGLRWSRDDERAYHGCSVRLIYSHPNPLRLRPPLYYLFFRGMDFHVFNVVFKVCKNQLLRTPRHNHPSSSERRWQSGKGLHCGRRAESGKITSVPTLSSRSSTMIAPQGTTGKEEKESPVYPPKLAGTHPPQFKSNQP
jgi:hypothetical protein